MFRNISKSSVINFVCVIIGIVAAYLVFQNLHPENWMSKPQDAITLQDMDGKASEEFVGHPAGDDIPRISGKEEFEELYNDFEYVTLEPKSIVSTGVSSLKPWVDPYRKYRNGRQKLRKKVMETIWDYEGSGIPYYLLECPDGTYIIAQIPDSYVKAIKRGESVTLPICYKKSLTNGADSYLEDLCEKYDASMKGVLYCFDDSWYEEHDTVIFFIRVGAAIIALFAVGIVLITVCEKIFHIKSEK